MSEMTQTPMTASHDARAQTTGITKGARVVFPVTVGGLGREALDNYTETKTVWVGL